MVGIVYIAKDAGRVSLVTNGMAEEEMRGAKYHILSIMHFSDVERPSGTAVVRDNKVRRPALHL